MPRPAAPLTHQEIVVNRLDVESAGVSRQHAVSADDAVARDDNGDWIAAVCCAGLSAMAATFALTVGAVGDASGELRPQIEEGHPRVGQLVREPRHRIAERGDVDW